MLRNALILDLEADVEAVNSRVRETLDDSCEGSASSPTETLSPTVWHADMIEPLGQALV